MKKSGVFFMAKIRKVASPNVQIASKSHRLKKVKISIVAVFCLLIIAFLYFQIFFRNNEVEALSNYGSRGSEVTQIQT